MSDHRPMSSTNAPLRASSAADRGLVDYSTSITGRRDGRRSLNMDASQWCGLVWHGRARRWYAENVDQFPSPFSTERSVGGHILRRETWSTKNGERR
ncbi:MAG: hypothetical protein JXM79_00625 [Sedimentisphaerales bacterium]|nr:hypothetical protein [Sedimentisphaerales bacterium]